MGSTVRTGKYFAWCRGLKGLIPVKFHDGINESDAKRVVQSHQIEDLSISFGELARKFPAPVSEEYPAAWPDFEDKFNGRRTPSQSSEIYPAERFDSGPKNTIDNQPGYGIGNFQVSGRATAQSFNFSSPDKY